MLQDFMYSRQSPSHILYSCPELTTVIKLPTETFPGGTVVKNSPANAGEVDSIPGSGRSTGGGNGNPLQCSCLKNPMNREAWQTIVHGVTKSQTRLSD